MPAQRGQGLDLFKLAAALFAVAALGSWFMRRSVDEGGASDATLPAVTALLVDQSASVTRARPLWRRWVVRRLGAAVRDAAARGDDVALITFGVTAERKAGPLPAPRFVEELHRRAPDWLALPEAGADLGSELEAAAKVAAALLSEAGRAPGTIVVLGDGEFTGEDPSGTLLQDSSWRLVHVPPPAPERLDLGVVRVLAPDQVAPGTAVPVELDLSLTGPSLRERPRVLVDWTIELTGTDSTTRGLGITTSDSGEVKSGLTLQGTSEVDVPPSARAALASGQARRFRVSVTLPGAAEGSALLRASVRLEGVQRDPVPENDSGVARWTVGDPVRVVVVAPEGALRTATSLFTGAALDGIEFRGVPLRGGRSSGVRSSGEAAGQGGGGGLTAVLAADPEDLPDAVVTIGLPYSALPGAALARFVEERGGGWLHAAGWSLLESRADPALQAIAALEPDRDPKPPRDIVFFVDGSGSMEGKRWRRMRTALRQLFPSIPATDTLSLRFFTRSMGREEFRFDSGGDDSKSREAALRRLLRLHVPGGATDILASLSELIKSRANRVHAVEGKEPDGLVVLISDGETRSNAGRRKVVRQRLLDGRDQLVAIHVGDGRGATFLKGLLPRGEEVILAGELEGLLDVLQEAVHDLALVEGGRLVAAGDPEPEGQGSSPDASDQGAGSVAGAQAFGVAVADVRSRIPSVDPITVARAIPARAADGAQPLAMLKSEALALLGRSSVFAAAGQRGLGWAAGLAAPLVTAGADATGGPGGGPGGGDDWARGVRERPGWLGPLFRAAARSRALADAALGPADTSAPRLTWVHEARTAFGARTSKRGSFLVIEGLGEEAPSDLEVEFRLSGGVQPRGGLDQASDPGRTLARVPAGWLPSAVDPRTSRVVPQPEELGSYLGRGEVVVRLTSKSQPGWQRPVCVVPSPGIAELRGFQVAGGGRVAPALVHAGRQVLPGDRLRENPAADDDPGPRRGHPAVPWILFSGLLALFGGALMTLRDG